MYNLRKLNYSWAETIRDHWTGKKIGTKYFTECKLENGERVSKEEWFSRVEKIAKLLNEEVILETLIKLAEEEKWLKTEQDKKEYAYELYAYRTFESKDWACRDAFIKIFPGQVH